MVFVPSIEKLGEAAFLPEYPANLILTSQTVPIMAGVAEKESIMILFGKRDVWRILQTFSDIKI